MAKFRKKPVVIEARQLTQENILELGTWCEDKIKCYAKGQELPEDQYSIEIFTLEETHRADIGDWIIQGVKKEFYPCKPDIFEMTYEAVED